MNDFQYVLMNIRIGFLLLKGDIEHWLTKNILNHFDTNVK